MSAKFKVGQIVCTTGAKGLPFRIIKVVEVEGDVYYKWNRKNAMAEEAVRALTDAEKGQVEESGEIVVTVSSNPVSLSHSLTRQIDAIEKGEKESKR